MSTLRLLPIVLFATSSLLVLKVVGLATGMGSFAIGPTVAIAAGSEGGHGGGGGEGGGGGGGTEGEALDDSISLGEPLDLAKEAADLAKKAKPPHGGGGEAPAEGEAGAAPAAGEHAAAPAEGAGADHGAQPAGGEHAAASAEGAAAGEHAAAPAAGEHAAAPPAGEHAATPAVGGEHAATPAAGGEHAAAPANEGHAAPPGEGGEGSGLPAGVSTTRPKEYQPPPSASEEAIRDALANRRKLLDDREKDIDLRMKLLQAAEQKLQQRVDELKSIQEQLGQVPGGGGAGDAGAAAAPAAGGAAPGAAQAGANEPESDQLKALVAMYEAMKPKAAAEVFNTLDLTVLVAIARHMNPRKLSPILAAMEPAHAAKVTIALAGDQGPRQIVIRNLNEASALPSAQYVEPPPPPMVSEQATPEPLPGTADPLALPKIGPAPNG